MPPCGNFGILIIGGDSSSYISPHNQAEKSIKPVNTALALNNKITSKIVPFNDDSSAVDELSFHSGALSQSDCSVTTLSELDSEDGLENKLDSKVDVTEDHIRDLLTPLKILQTQAACAEIRGGTAVNYCYCFILLDELPFSYRNMSYNYISLIGQAGGISTLEYKHFFTDPRVGRIRMIKKKRRALSSDLVDNYQSQYGRLTNNNTLTILGNSRFATSSANTVNEIHPHEWVPPHKEMVWRVNHKTGKFEKSSFDVMIHMSHIGDLHAFAAYDHTMTHVDCGLWLQRVLQIPNESLGDSHKIAGFLDLFRVQGRWPAAARLAYIRTILSSAIDVCGGNSLATDSPTTFPTAEYWSEWGIFFDEIWCRHVNNIIKFTPGRNAVGEFQYKLDLLSEKQLVQDLLEALSLIPESLMWSNIQRTTFVTSAVRGFLRSDLYNAMTEFLSRGIGTFGIQAHCSLEPGVVVLARFE